MYCKPILIITILSFLSMCGCMKDPIKAQAKLDNRKDMELPAYIGPRAKVVVADLKWKIGHGRGRMKLSFGEQSVEVVRKKSIGYTTGLRDMLVSAMVQTRRYQVLERKTLDLLKQETVSSTSGGTDGVSEQKETTGQADLLIMGTVTGWEPGTAESGSRTGAEIILDGSTQSINEESSMGMDICIVDGKTSKVLAATRVEGVAKDADLTGYLGAFGGSSEMAAGLGVYANTPMEKAIRICLNNAIKYIVENVPQSY